MTNTQNTKYKYMLGKNENCMNYTALSFGNRKITYEEMHDRIWKYVKLLYSKGIREGDVIGICVYNTPEAVYLFYALNIIGAVVVGYNPFDKKEKTKIDIELTKPKMVISVDMCYNNFKDWEKALDFSTIIYSAVDSMNEMKIKFAYKLLQLKNGIPILPNRDIRLSSLLKKDYSNINPIEAQFKKDELRDILFTGGSTGIHKGVELSDNSLNSVVEGMNSIFEAKPGMIHLGNIPFGHMAYGRSILHFALCNNMEYALTLKALPKDFYDELVRTHANAAVGGPPHWVSLIEKQGEKFVPSSKLKKGTLEGLHYATSGGEAKKANTEAAINEALRYCGSDAILGDGLGTTETNGSIFINNGRVHGLGTIGVPISTVEVKLVDKDTGEEVKPGEIGLLKVAGESVMLRYHNNPEETANATEYKEGKKWLTPGDLLVENPTGEYTYIGRVKRNFVSGCDNIYPEELENLLLKIPEIREVVVTPISDEIVQFIPRYHISLNNPNVDTKTLEEKIERLVITSLNENWLPGSIVYYEEPLKRMSNSKIDIPYYMKQDAIAIQNDKINNTQARKVRVKKM